MANDKRTVTTDALETLGTIHSKPEHRDAIHLAVEPVAAWETMKPGARITVRNGVAHLAIGDEALGIVDPFLPRPVTHGERFWFVMMPRMVHSLRHVWTHPEFPDAERSEAIQLERQPLKEKAESYLKDFAEGAGITYTRLMDGATEYLESGYGMLGGAEFEGVYAGDEFWDAYSLVTGRTVLSSERGGLFSCSC